MARAMLNYTLDLLEKVSFDASLFSKEVQKAFKTLQPHEILELKIFLQNLIQKKPQLEAYVNSYVIC